jgi:formylglycine-generating enzyme required for sulfatase activity
VYNDFIKLVADPNEETILLPDNVLLVMKWIPAGSFTMGSLVYPTESPQHTVTLGGFWMGKYELTVAQMKAVTGTDACVPCGNTSANPNAPAVNINWNDAHTFLTALNSYTGKTFRLPSEAEFQYALSGGKTTAYYWGDDLSVAGDYAWYWDNAAGLGIYPMHLVGQKKPNAYGLYDMVGNAIEWCEDDWHATYSGAPTNGTAWVDSPRGERRVFHDFGAFDYGDGLRTAARNSYVPLSSDFSIGMRVVRIP